jgi:hypothetical protein
MDKLNEIYPKKNESITYRKMPKGVLTESGFALNNTAMEILNLCDSKTSAASIAKKMAQKYGIDDETMKADVLETLESLKDAKIITT